ncbi:hypothetical protein ACLOJK_032818 [Asimina triloba]
MPAFWAHSYRTASPRFPQDTPRWITLSHGTQGIRLIRARLLPARNKTSLFSLSDGRTIQNPRPRPAAACTAFDSTAEKRRRDSRNRFTHSHHEFPPRAGVISVADSAKMAHGGYGRHRIAERRPLSRRSKGLSGGIDKKKKPKSVSLKNQIRSLERMLRQVMNFKLEIEKRQQKIERGRRNGEEWLLQGCIFKNLPFEVKKAQEAKLEELKKQQELHKRLAIERKIFLRNRKIKFFERRKIERRIRRLEKMQRTSSYPNAERDMADQLSKLKEDLEYVRFFPKNEKYVSLFMGGDSAEVVDRRNRLRKQIKDNLMAAAASGKDMEETGSEDDGLLDMSEDDFFMSGSSSDEADADDEWTDKSTREQASSTSGKGASGMSSDEKTQRQMFARVPKPPPRPLTNPSKVTGHAQGRLPRSTNRGQPVEKAEFPTTSNTSQGRSGHSSRSRGSSNRWTGHSSNLSSNSDAHKPRRKRRPKKKKQKIFNTKAHVSSHPNS